MLPFFHRGFEAEGINAQNMEMWTLLICIIWIYIIWISFTWNKLLNDRKSLVVSVLGRDHKQEEFTTCTINSNAHAEEFTQDTKAVEDNLKEETEVLDISGELKIKALFLKVTQMEM